MQRVLLMTCTRANFAKSLRNSKTVGNACKFGALHTFHQLTTLCIRLKRIALISPQ